MFANICRVIGLQDVEHCNDSHIWRLLMSRVDLVEQPSRPFHLKTWLKLLVRAVCKLQAVVLYAAPSPGQGRTLHAWHQHGVIRHSSLTAPSLTSS